MPRRKRKKGDEAEKVQAEKPKALRVAKNLGIFWTTEMWNLAVKSPTSKACGQDPVRKGEEYVLPSEDPGGKKIIGVSREGLAVPFRTGLSSWGVLENVF